MAFRVGGAPHLNNIELGRHGRSRSNVWTYAGVNTFRAGRMDDLAAHPTAKPVALVADAMKDCTARNDIVLDTFCGSGTTVLAAEKVGRRGYENTQKPTPNESAAAPDDIDQNAVTGTPADGPYNRSVETRFQPGRSGNPSGRPKGSRNKSTIV